jgi:tripartite-type tricarboxylate transporter receptor subunit TctC
VGRCRPRRAHGRAEPVADFYKGKTITIVVGGGAGGGFAIAARVLGMHMPRHVPGNPEFIVQAMPGAGGSRATAYLYNAAPQDGTVIAIILPAAVTAPLLRPLKYDTSKSHWLGSITPMSVVLSAWHTAPAKSLEEIKKTEFLMATSNKLADNYLVAAFLNAVVGTRFRVISGFDGADAQNLAMEKGEAHGRGSYYLSFAVSKPHWMRDGSVTHLIQLGPPIKELPQVPRLVDLVKTDEQRQIVTFMEAGAAVGQGFYAPPGTPPERVGALKAAFEATMKDPAFLEEAAKRSMVVEPVRGEDLQRAVEAAFQTPKPVIDRFKQMVKLEASDFAHK